MLIRREQPFDIDAVARVHTAAFAGPTGAGMLSQEAALVAALRASPAWIAPLSLVAVAGDVVVGHVLCTRATLDRTKPVLALAPIGVVPERQRIGVGQALMHAMLGAAEALDEPLVGLLGDPGYYARFGFAVATKQNIEPPDPAWRDHFQVRHLHPSGPSFGGQFHYPAAFDAL